MGFSALEIVHYECLVGRTHAAAARHAVAARRHWADARRMRATQPRLSPRSRRPSHCTGHAADRDTTMFDSKTIHDITAVAERLGLEPATLLAVAEVESGGKAFALVAGSPEPLIRFEGHYFDKRLSGEKRAQARAAGLASPLAGGVANPRGQAARWAMLARAASTTRRRTNRSPGASARSWARTGTGSATTASR